MPRTAEQLDKIREESRLKILESALELYARHGYAGTSVRMIADAAGISQGLLYNYFDAKDALLRAVFEQGMADVNESFGRVAAGATPETRLEDLVRAVFDIVAAHLDFWRLSYQLRMQPTVLGILGDSVQASTNVILARLGELLRGAASGSPASAAVEARVLFAAIDGAAQHYALDPLHYPVEDVSRALARRFAPGLDASPKSLEREAP